MSSHNISILLDYIWAPIVLWLVATWRKLSGHETRTRLLEQAELHHEQQRQEDKNLRDEQRKEMIDTIQAHHNSVKSDLTNIRKLIKNGHG